MKNRILAAAAAAVVSLSLSAPVASAELTQTERDQFLTDPVGAIAWQSIKGSSNALRADGGSFTAASLYSMTSPGQNIGMPALQGLSLIHI